MTCPACLTVNAGFWGGSYRLTCTKVANHRGRHSAGPPAGLKVAWEGGSDPLITWR